MHYQYALSCENSNKYKENAGFDYLVENKFPPMPVVSVVAHKHGCLKTIQLENQKELVAKFKVIAP